MFLKHLIQILRAHILPLTNVAFNKSGSKYVHLLTLLCKLQIKQQTSVFIY